MLPYWERGVRLERFFKATIAALTLGVVIVLLAGSSPARLKGLAYVQKTQDAVFRLLGGETSRAQSDLLWKMRRQKGVELTHQSMVNYCATATPEMRHFLEITGLTPDDSIIRWGRGDQIFLLSSKVFAKDDNGRSYRLRPSTKSIWLRQITMQNGPFIPLQVPDTPEVRAATAAVGGIVELTAATTTNSWGCRGPEPDTSAQMRGLVLGDSFMQGMFVGDDDTPSRMLERDLRARWKTSVAVLNTGNIGYSPEQYYFTLKEYGDRFRPRFVVVSVCPNDFGDGDEAIYGRGDMWDEAHHWFEEIVMWCRARNVLCLMVPLPTDVQFFGTRHDEWYPGRVGNIFPSSALNYCDPLDVFITEHLRLVQEGTRAGHRPTASLLYNRQFNDNHLSTLGTALWGKVVGDRVSVLIEPPQSGGEKTREAQRQQGAPAQQPPSL
jgi:hypothetical protein